MSRNGKRHVLILGMAVLLTGLLMVQPAAAGKKNTVIGEIVSFDLDSNLLVVRDSNGGGDITFHTSKRTSVIGLRTGPQQDGVDVLVGMQGAKVSIKFKDNGKGKEASFIRIRPKKA